MQLMKTGREERKTWKAWLILPASTENLAEMLPNSVLLSSESGDRVVRQGKVPSPIHDPPVQRLEFPHVFIIGLADGFFPIRERLTGKEIWKRKKAFLCCIHSGRTLLAPCFPHAFKSKRNPDRLMQSRFLKELPESHYDSYNAHSSYRRTGWNQYGGQGRGYGRSF
jgi:superfamily I DNA/RNA helicase